MKVYQLPSCWFEQNYMRNVYYLAKYAWTHLHETVTSILVAGTVEWSGSKSPIEAIVTLEMFNLFSFLFFFKQTPKFSVFHPTLCFCAESNEGERSGDRDKTATWLGKSGRARGSTTRYLCDAPPRTTASMCLLSRSARGKASTLTHSDLGCVPLHTLNSVPR